MVTENNPENSDSGAIEAFIAAFEANRELLLNMARSYTKNMEDAEDVLHDILVRVLQKFRGDDFDPNFNYTGYLYKSVKNTCLNLIRNNKRRSKNNKRSNIADRHLPDQVERVIVAELSNIMQSTLESMPNGIFRDIFRLRELEEFSYLELGEELGIPQGTVMSRMHRARREFAETLAKNK